MAAFMFGAPVLLGWLLGGLATGLALFIASMAPEPLQRLGRYGGAGVTLTWADAAACPARRQGLGPTPPAPLTTAADHPSPWLAIGRPGSVPARPAA